MVLQILSHLFHHLDKSFLFQALEATHGLIAVGFLKTSSEIKTQLRKDSSF
jgi:hypothetical protein